MVTLTWYTVGLLKKFAYEKGCIVHRGDNERPYIKGACVCVCFFVVILLLLFLERGMTWVF